ncbi:MAG: hypothetical protein WD709_05410, partial [Gammaproteobacteria bacterium]
NLSPHQNNTTTPIYRVGFLFNHEHLHQISHSATVGFVLSTLSPAVEVILIASSAAQLDYLQTLARDYPDHNCKFRLITLSPLLKTIGTVIDKALPFTKVMMLRQNLEVFREQDALVVPEKTSLLLRSRFGLSDLKFIYTAHGAGDRAIGFDRTTANFDLIFLSGEKIRRRMQAEGILKTASSRIIGYPKFDAVDAFGRKPEKLFNNDRPTVLYNPHFDPELSSWYKHGQAILEYFYRSDRYNLIFAPHVMLFTRKIHLSPTKYRPGWVWKIPSRYKSCPHILIDTGSLACTDMTYTLAADVYLGDVSSQIWEFLVHPKPCLFVNTHNVAWEDDPNYLHWHTG